MYLLYTQIGSAFIAGVIFAAGLIPLNRWIAGRIAVYSQQLMDAKDSRISVSQEALANAKHIKLLAWEDVFMDKILSECTFFVRYSVFNEISAHILRMSSKRT